MLSNNLLLRVFLLLHLILTLYSVKNKSVVIIKKSKVEIILRDINGILRDYIELSSVTDSDKDLFL